MRDKQPYKNPYVDIYYFVQPDKFAFVQGKYVYPADSLEEAMQLRKSMRASDRQAVREAQWETGMDNTKENMN